MASKQGIKLVEFRGRRYGIIAGTDRWVMPVGDGNWATTQRPNGYKTPDDSEDESDGDSGANDGEDNEESDEDSEGGDEQEAGTPRQGPSSVSQIQAGVRRLNMQQSSALPNLPPGQMPQGHHPPIRVATSLQTEPASEITQKELYDTSIAADVLIKATRSQDQKLHSAYHIRSSPREFFKLGKVFSMLWSEPAGASLSTSRTQIGLYGERFFQEIRRFIVIMEGANACTALAINTRGDRGCAGYGLNKSDFGIVHVKREPPLPSDDELPHEDEPGMLEPVRINLDDRDDSLRLKSRINYGKLYTIEHNVKVKPVGKLHQDSVELFFRQVKTSLNARIGTPRQQMTPRSQAGPSRSRGGLGAYSARGGRGGFVVTGSGRGLSAQPASLHTLSSSPQPFTPLVQPHALTGESLQHAGGGTGMVPLSRGHSTSAVLQYGSTTSVTPQLAYSGSHSGNVSGKAPVGHVYPDSNQAHQQHSSMSPNVSIQQPLGSRAGAVPGHDYSDSAQMHYSLSASPPADRALQHQNVRALEGPSQGSRALDHVDFNVYGDKYVEHLIQQGMTRDEALAHLERRKARQRAGEQHADQNYDSQPPPPPSSGNGKRKQRAGHRRK